MLPRLVSRKKGHLWTTVSAVLPSLILFFPLVAAAAPDIEMTGFGIVQETDSGRWEIKAGRAAYNGQGDVILERVSARMINGGMELVSVVSDTGRYESAGLILHLEGSVIVASGLGSRFEAPRLQWNGPAAVMTARDGVWLKRGGITVSGDSIKFVVDTGTATVTGNVKTTIKDRKGLR